jgi:hypothetical protein
MAILERAEDLEVASIMNAATALTTADLEGIELFNSFASHEDDLILEDHAVSLVGSFIEWVPGTGWAPVAD